MEHNANHIIPLYCHLPVSCRSLLDRCGFLGSCKSEWVVLGALGFMNNVEFEKKKISN